MLRDPAAEMARLDAPWAAIYPEKIKLKRERMREGALPFLRASAPIFFARLREALAPDEPLARWLAGDVEAPVHLVWCAGDVHMENFGAYRTNEGHERFGLNDFDDALPAPLEIDLLRLAASIQVAARTKHLDGRTSVALSKRLLDGYAHHVGEELLPDPSAKDLGPAVEKLLDVATDATREAFLDKRAPLHKGKRAFVTSDRYPALDPVERARALGAFERAVESLPAHEKPGFYNVVDVAGRVAGLGSLGCTRYAILVEGGSKGNCLMELKEAKPASLERHGCPHLAPQDEAERVVEAQVALRGERSPHLGHALCEGRPVYLRRLHHHEQRVELDDVKPGELEGVVDAEAVALARSHARSRKPLGLARIPRPDEAQIAQWLLLAGRLAGAVEGDYLAFCSST